MSYDVETEAAKVFEKRSLKIPMGEHEIEILKDFVNYEKFRNAPAPDFAQLDFMRAFRLEEMAVKNGQAYLAKQNPNKTLVHGYDKTRGW